MNDTKIIHVPNDTKIRRWLKRTEEKTGIKPEFAILAVLRQAAEAVQNGDEEVINGYSNTKERKPA